MDPNAEDSVTPSGIFMGEVAPPFMSRQGRRNRAANGSPIPNLGQAIVHLREWRGPRVRPTLLKWLL